MESAYDIQSIPKGLVLLINNEIFPNTSFERRDGSDKDFQELKSLFKHLGFKVLPYYNLRYHEFTRVIKSFALIEEHWNMDCCILFIMTHGHRDKVNPHAVDLLTVDNKFVSSDWVKEQFNSENCRSLMNKPKIMIFEACRTKGPKVMQVKRPKKLLREKTPPHISDMICVHSCLPGYESFTFSKTGSCFIQELCETIKAEGATMHLIAILNKVDMKLRKRFIEKSTIPYQALYIENWSFNKLMFLSSRAVKYYKAAWDTIGGKKKEARYEKPPASRPLLISRQELKKALNGIIENRLLPEFKKQLNNPLLNTFVNQEVIQ
nr:caspase-2 isoform X1 [Halyomorpha halys]